MRKFFVSGVLTLVIVYSCIWFLTSKIVEGRTYQYLKHLKQEKSIDEYSGNIYITGFPFSFNINLSHPRVKFQKADTHYNTQCDMLFDGILSVQLRFFSNKIKIKSVGDLHLKGHLNHYNFDSTIGSKNSSYQIRLVDSLILSALKGSIGKARKAKDLIVALIDKIIIHNEDIRIINKLSNTLLFYANEVDLNIKIKGNENVLNVRFIEHLSDAEFHKEFNVLSTELLSLPFIHKVVNSIDINVRNYFDIFSFDKLGKINHDIDVKISMQKNLTSVKINKLKLNDAAYDIDSSGQINLNNTSSIDIEFKSRFSELWYKLMKIYAHKMRLNDIEKRSFGVGKHSVVSNIFNAIFNFVRNSFLSKGSYASYVPKLHTMGMIQGDIDATYQKTKSTFNLNVNKFKIQTSRFTIDANGNAQNIGQGGDRYRLKALFTNYSHIVDNLVKYVNRITQNTGQVFFIVGKKLTISKTTSDRIKFFLREISDDSASNSVNLKLTVNNTDGGTCPAVGKYNSKEFCRLWHGFVFNLLLLQITKDLDPIQMLKMLKNPLNLPEALAKNAGKTAESIVGGVFDLLGGKINK